MRVGLVFENLVISDKCKTLFGVIILLSRFENLVISDKCKTMLHSYNYPF